MNDAPDVGTLVTINRSFPLNDLRIGDIGRVLGAERTFMGHRWSLRLQILRTDTRHWVDEAWTDFRGVNVKQDWTGWRLLE